MNKSTVVTSSWRCPASLSSFSVDIILSSIRSSCFFPIDRQYWTRNYQQSENFFVYTNGSWSLDWSQDGSSRDHAVGNWHSIRNIGNCCLRRIFLNFLCLKYCNL